MEGLNCCSSVVIMPAHYLYIWKTCYLKQLTEEPSYRHDNLVVVVVVRKAAGTKFLQV